MDSSQLEGDRDSYTLVARKPAFGLPTGCPDCLPVYIYLKFAGFPFRLDFNSSLPDSDQIPYVESGTYVAFNNESGGVIERLKEDGIVDLDAEFQSVPEWTSIKAMISSWLADATTYELWLGTDGKSTGKIYYSDLPWVVRKGLFVKQSYSVKQQLKITSENAERREAEIYRRAKLAYDALSTKLGEQEFLFDNRLSSLDALLLGHLLFVLDALPESSYLRSSLFEHANLIRYAAKLKSEFLEGGSSASSSGIHSESSSSFRWRKPPNASARPRGEAKREKTEEEKKFRRRAKWFLAAQLVTILVFVSVVGGYDFSTVEAEDDGEGFGYE